MPQIPSPSNRPQQPGEWEKHSACWVAWPAAGDLWEENLAPAQAEFTNLCRMIADFDARTQTCRGERLEVLVRDEIAERAATRALKDFNARFHRVPYGDIWLRDTAPIFLRHEKKLVSAQFQFNGWGKKYVLDHDDQIAARISELTSQDATARKFDWILEGGSVDVDGEGTCLTTEQCLLNPNRNPGWTKDVAETRLKEALGVEKILWITEGLLNDHTDGHIDTIVRFVAPGKVVCMMPESESDPNARVLRQIRAELAAMTDARGRALEVIEVPSPGTVLSADEEIMPASYVNFYIGNQTVSVPQYGVAADAAAVQAISRCFPGRRTMGLSAKHILTGGGAFHCITQQQPMVNV